MMPKPGRRSALVTLAALGLLLALFVFKSFTLPILSTNSIAELEAVLVGNDTQYVLVRGHDRSDPVLLFVHGGPGMPAMYLAHAFQRALEEHFVVVHWDQRGAGKSYKRDQDLSRLRINVLLDDMSTVIAAIRQRFDGQKVWIVGHSHGSYLGALYACLNPGDVFAFVGVGQLVNVDDGGRVRSIQLRHIREKMPELRDVDDARILDMGLETLLFETGAELYGKTSFFPLLLSGLLAPEYSLFDAINVGRGSAISSRHMVYDMPTDLVEACSTMNVPVAMIMGEHDYVTPVVIAEEYFEQIRAPAKRWFLIPETSHFPFYENPDSFTRVLIELKNSWYGIQSNRKRPVYDAVADANDRNVIPSIREQQARRPPPRPASLW